jgi:hypothetical protein
MGLGDGLIEKAGEEAGKVADKLDNTVDDGIARLIAGARLLWGEIKTWLSSKKLTGSFSWNISLEDK